MQKKEKILLAGKISPTNCTDKKDFDFLKKEKEKIEKGNNEKYNTMTDLVKRGLNLTRKHDNNNSISFELENKKLKKLFQQERNLGKNDRTVILEALSLYFRFKQGQFKKAFDLEEEIENQIIPEIDSILEEKITGLHDNIQKLLANLKNVENLEIDEDKKGETEENLEEVANAIDGLIDI